MKKEKSYEWWRFLKLLKYYIKEAAIVVNEIMFLSCPLMFQNCTPALTTRIGKEISVHTSWITHQNLLEEYRMEFFTSEEFTSHECLSKSYSTFSEHDKCIWYSTLLLYYGTKQFIPEHRILYLTNLKCHKEK